MLGIVGLHSLHFAVHSLEKTRRFYEDQLGFVPLWRASDALVARSGQESIVYGGGTARIVLSAPKTETCKAARYLKQHPEGVMSVAFAVRDVHQAFSVLERRGATPLSDVNERGDYRDFEIAT